MKSISVAATTLHLNPLPMHSGLYFMFLKMSSALNLTDSSFTPSVFISGRVGGGGPFGFGGGADWRRGWETVRVLCVGLAFSTPSGTDPTAPAVKFFFLPNQLPLFLLVRLGAWLLMVAGEPGLSDFRLSDDERVRKPRNLRTDDGRLSGCRGLVGDKVLAASLVCVWCS